MPSQEEYLDQLLQNIVENHENVESDFAEENTTAVEITDDEIDAMLQSAIEEHEIDNVDVDKSVESEEPENFGDLLAKEETQALDDLYSHEADEANKAPSTVEETSEMTEEEINRLLEASQSESVLLSEGSETLEDIAEEDMLAGLLNESDDEELKEIQNLLQKSDNNELIEEASEEYADEIINEMPEIEPLSKAEEKRRKREAKKEAKRAAKEARKAARKASKAPKTEDPNEMDAFDNSETAMEGIEQSVTELDDAAQASNESLLEEDLLRELEVFDFLNEVPEKESIREISDSAGEDSLTQVMEQEVAKKTKKGLFARIRDFINEEDDESENEDIQLSGENESIIKEMDKEKDKEKKKSKKARTEKLSKKEKQPKKEKQQEEAEFAGKKIPIKQIMMVAAVCLSIGVAIVVFVQVVGDYSDKKAGRKAFYEEDYQTCYQNLLGKDLNESEQVMYSKSESILTIRMWIREYELLAGEGQEAKALDSLLQSVYLYPTLYSYAATWNADTEVAQSYNRILNILSEKYHLTEEQAKEITNNPDDIEYTKMVMAIVNGEAFGSWNQKDITDNTEALQDPLPEEDELKDANFVDNHI